MFKESQVPLCKCTLQRNRPRFERCCPLFEQMREMISASCSSFIGGSRFITLAKLLVAATTIARTVLPDAAAARGAYNNWKQDNGEEWNGRK